MAQAKKRSATGQRKHALSGVGFATASPVVNVAPAFMSITPLTPCNLEVGSVTRDTIQRVLRMLLAEAPWASRLLAPPASTSNHPVSSKTWVTAEAERMKTANEIPALKTDFAKELARRMKKAALADPSIRPVQWETIMNRLASWGLWLVK